MHKDTHVVLASRRISKETFVLSLERKGLTFLPGQFANLGLPALGINREYCFYSGTDEETLDFLIKEVNAGTVSSRLAQVQNGAMVDVDGAYGLFTLQTPSDRQLKHIFICTGTGIAPFRSYVKSFPNVNYSIIHGVPSLDEAYDRGDYAAGKYLCCTSRDGSGDFRGRVTDYLRQHELDTGAIYYLCGNRNMITDVYEILSSRNVNGSQIRSEVFY